MKITEPKTPYVRYNAETDEIEGGTYHVSTLDVFDDHFHTYTQTYQTWI